ncbi:hypothetical protein BUALT_Bualt18G0045300 [Buddleja alternifolia]|uniref:Uncharacterized protein n=1 Tax=Buddleja alternifolia TaxID=168488 RepID=A0AAV6W8M5_9LAMI|nr:hypothetical protein BUALT_Bualt18G0045300 [Buddleja alternifolia]
MEERSLRQASVAQIHSKNDTMATMQSDLYSVVVAIQVQLQSIEDQMQSYHKNKSVLGEGLSANTERVVTTIPEDQKVSLASIHLEGKAELWFQSYLEGNDYLSWEQFILVVLERIDDINPELMIASFISGLHDDIKGVVISLKPSTLSQAISIAKQQELTIDAIVKRADEEEAYLAESEGIDNHEEEISNEDM